MTPSSDSTHSLVSSGSMSGSWLGRPSLITGRLRSLATGVPSRDGVSCLVHPILPRAGWRRHVEHLAGLVPAGNRTFTPISPGSSLGQALRHRRPVGGPILNVDP